MVKERILSRILKRELVPSETVIAIVDAIAEEFEAIAKSFSLIRDALDKKVDKKKAKKKAKKKVAKKKVAKKKVTKKKVAKKKTKKKVSKK